MVATRLSKLSSNEDVFLSEINVYKEALKNSGYTSPLSFVQSTDKGQRKKRCRSKNVIWFNPPYCQTVKSSIGAKFLSLIDKHFKDTDLAKYFNKSTVAKST